MKINKIQENKIATFRPKQHIKNTSNNQNINKQEIILPKNPKYFQVLNHINFKSSFIAIPRFQQNSLVGLNLRIPISHDYKITLELDKEDSLEVFLDENGDLDNSAIDFFAKYYADFYRAKKEMYEKEKAALLAIINYNPSTKLTVIDSKKDVQNALIKSEDSSDETYGETLLNSIMDLETKKNFAIKRLNKIENDFRASSITIAKEIINIIKLSRQDDGSIDESNFDKKLAIAVLLTHYNKEAQKDCTDYIFKMSQDENGKIDLTFCKTLLDYLIACTKGESIQEEIYLSAQLIKKYQTQDPLNYTTIIEDIITQTQLENISAF